MIRSALRFAILPLLLTDGAARADVTETLRLALNAAGLNQATVQQRPRLLSDTGPSYLSAQLGAGSKRAVSAIPGVSPTIR